MASTPSAPPRTPPDRRLAISVALLALALLASMLGWLAWQFAQLPSGIAATLRIALFALPLLLLAGGSVIGLLIAYNRWGRLEIVKADKTIALTQASAQRFPAGLQSLSYHDASKQLPAPAPVADVPALPPPAPDVPTFGQLLAAGKIGPGQRLLLGIDAGSGQPLEGTWKSLYSTGIGGMTGSGKSWLGAFLIAQSVAAGARLIIVDPHHGDAESLGTRLAPLRAAFMCDVASSPTQIESAIKLAADKLDRRSKGQASSWPLLLVVDEWTSLLRGDLGDVLTATALDFAEQGRKFGCFALLAAQGWQVDAAGPVRDRLASNYVMRQRPDQARYQLGLRAGQLPLDVRFLKDGECYLLSVKGDLIKTIIPHITEQDIAHVGGLLEQGSGPTGQPFGFVPAPKSRAVRAPIGAAMEPDRSQCGAGSVAPQSARAISPEAAHALALLHEGNDLPEIVLKLRNVSSKQSGSRYQAALKDVTALIREATKGA
jgi:Helicase HerA, central domain